MTLLRKAFLFTSFGIDVNFVVYNLIYGFARGAICFVMTVVDAVSI